MGVMGRMAGRAVGKARSASKRGVAAVKARGPSLATIQARQGIVGNVARSVVPQRVGASAPRAKTTSPALQATKAGAVQSGVAVQSPMTKRVKAVTAKGAQGRGTKALKNPVGAVKSLAKTSIKTIKAPMGTGARIAAGAAVKAKEATAQVAAGTAAGGRAAGRAAVRTTQKSVNTIKQGGKNAAKGISKGFGKLGNILPKPGTLLLMAGVGIVLVVVAVTAGPRLLAGAALPAG